MADDAQAILKSVRIAHHMTQQQMANLLSVSVEQYKRFEYGQVIPEMSDVDRIEETLGEAGLFRRWARAQYPEIVKHFGVEDAPDVGLLGSIVQAKHEMRDVLAMQERMERDALDGRIDDAALLAQYRRELTEARAAIDASLRQVSR